MITKTYLAIIYLIYYLVDIKNVMAGTVQQGNVPIYNTIANRNQPADYTFQIIPQSSIPKGGKVVVTFPYQYAPGLGISTVNSSTCNRRCDIFDHKVFFYFDSEEILSNIQISLTIYQVLNPLSAGGTGNFYVETSRGQNKYDENLIFGSLGISGDIDLLASTTIAVDSTGTTAAGQPTKYNFAFKTATFLPMNSYIELWIPNSGFTISNNPSCSTYPINGVQIQGQIKCQLIAGSTIIRVEGFSQDIKIGSDVGISVSMTNPTVSLFTANFRIVVYRANTKVVLAWSNFLKGLQITPGKMQYINFKPKQSLVVETKSKIIDYTITFLPKNPLLSGSIVEIKFPSDGSIQLFDNNSDYSTSYQLLYGLDDISADNPMDDSDVTNSYIRFKNFSPQTTPKEISIFIRIILPSLPGKSNTIVVTTYTSTSMTTIIDQDKSSVYVNVQSYNSQNSAIIVENQSINKYQANSLSNIQIYFTPPLPIPAGSVYRFILPDEFSLAAVSGSKCLVYAVASTVCKRKDQVITMNSSTVAGSAVTNGVQGKLYLNTFITTPVYQGAYLVDVTIYDSTQTTVLFTFSVLLIITPQPIASINDRVYMNFMNYAPAAATDYIRYGIMEISLTTVSLAIPQGKPSNLLTDPQGFIDVLFLSNYDQKLGTNLKFNEEFYCKALDGLFNIDDESIKCYLIKTLYANPLTSAPPVSYTAIRMKFFKAIQPNTYIRFHIPRILNPLTSTATIKVLLKQQSNRREQILNTSGVITIGYSNQAAKAPINLQNDAFLTFSPANYYLQKNFDVTIQFDNTSPAYAIGDFFILILPTFDTGFFPSDDSVTIEMIEAGVNYIQKIVIYHDINWILVEITNVNGGTSNLNPASTLKCHIKNLVYPRYSKVFGTIVQIGVYAAPAKITNNNICAISRTSASTPQVNDFTDIQIQVPFKAALYPGSYFEFYIQPQNDLLDGFSVEITFNSQFNLQKSFPSPSFYAPQLNALDSQGVIYTVQNNILTISNIQYHPAGSPFRVIVDGVKNPDMINQVTTGWSVIAYYQNKNNYINSRTNFNSYTTGSTFASSNVIFQGVYAFPSNAYVYSTYTVSFTPSSSFRAYATIKIVFPASTYSSLPSTPVCQVTGGLTTFKSCSLSGNTFILVTETSYNSDTVHFSVQDVYNPQPGITDGFIVQIYYDGMLLQDTDTSTLSLRTFTITGRASPLQVKQMDFFPINEAENGEYTFVLIPSNNLSSNTIIYIEFPPKYDNLLGSKLNCKSQGGLTSEIGCTIDQRVIKISGITSYTPSFDDPIILVISGIMNPNEYQDRNGGPFKIGTYSLFTNYFIDYNPNVGTLLTSSAPTWLKLQDMYPSNYYIRRTSTYFMQFIIDPSYPLPSINSQGQIIIEFPNQYDVPDWQALDCSSSNSDMNNLLCSISNNKVTVTGNLVQISGLTDLYINNLINPTDAGSTNPILIKAYDGFNKNIISKTFFNIDPSFFTFTVPGPYITVNNDNTIIVERGTQSQDLYLGVIYPCALNLTLVPTPSQEGITIIPSQIKLVLGDLKSKFRVSVDENVNGGNYYIYWSILGETTPPLYTPIKKTPVQVTTNKNIRISVGTLQEIPLGGWSLPTILSTAYAPNLSLEVLIRFKSSYPGITISSKSLLFGQGMNSVSFYLNSTAETTIQSGTLQLSLDGINSDVYTLSTTEIDFVIIGKDTSPPLLTDFSNTTTTQTSVTLTIGSSEVTQVFLMLALQGTESPSISDLQIQKKPKWKSTKTVYGNTIIGKTNQATYQFNNLQAQVLYTCYAYAVDRGGLWSALKQFDFKTVDRYNAADFVLNFQQSYLNSAEKRNIKKEVAFVLSLMQSQVIERRYVFATSRVLSYEEISNKSRALADEPSVNIYLQIISNPLTENFDSPYNLVTYLIKNQMTNLAARLTNLNTAATVKYSEFVKYIPTFLTTPSEIDTATNKVTISVNLDNYGYVYAMATKTQEDKGKPSNQQIMWGYNSTNGVVPSWKIEISEPYTKQNLTIPGMVPNTEYNVYIIGGSAHPGYPDLMESTQIQLISAKTLFIPSIPILDLSMSMIRFLVVNLMIIVIIFM